MFDSSEFIKQAIFAFLRGPGVFITAFISLHFGISDDVTVTFIGSAVLAGAMFIWSLFNKARTEKKIGAALALPAGSTHADLKEELS